MKNKIQNIETELTACQEAWNNNKDAKWTWCCHHSIRFEELTEPLENRIAYILTKKPENERAIRLHNFRPVRIELPKELKKARVELNKTCAEFNKVRAEWNKACAEFNKASAEWDKACAELINSNLHDQDWPDNTWNGKDIFGEA